MFPIAYVLSQRAMLPSLWGAHATDPVVPEPRRRTRLSIRRTPHANEGVHNA
jgi:hypothetical protein